MGNKIVCFSASNKPWPLSTYKGIMANVAFGWMFLTNASIIEVGIIVSQSYMVQIQDLIFRVLSIEVEILSQQL